MSMIILKLPYQFTKVSIFTSKLSSLFISWLLVVTGSFYFSALVNAGIVPSETNTYDVDEIGFAITAAYGVEPMLLCGSNEVL